MVGMFGEMWKIGRGERAGLWRDAQSRLPRSNRSWRPHRASTQCYGSHRQVNPSTCQGQKGTSGGTGRKDIRHATEVRCSRTGSSTKTLPWSRTSRASELFHSVKVSISSSGRYGRSKRNVYLAHPPFTHPRRTQLALSPNQTHWRANPFSNPLPHLTSLYTPLHSNTLYPLSIALHQFLHLCVLDRTAETTAFYQIDFP